MLGKNGSALPGLIIERLYPQFLTKTLKSVEKRIILVTGTNGKTTTTKMLVAALRGGNKRVVTNSTGSNMTRGLIAALVDDMNYFGSLQPTDWFVFEMDEAYAPIFTATISPTVVVGLNVLRDQLDRYGEIDTTAQFITKAASNSDTFVYNNMDPLLNAAAKKLEKGGVRTVPFGASKNLHHFVSNEQSLHGVKLNSDRVSADAILLTAVELGNNQQLTIRRGDKTYHLVLPIKGFHNALNATAVVASLQAVLSSNIQKNLAAIEAMPTPFGRGEQLYLDDKTITVALVKNPSGFTSNLETFAKQMKPDVILFVVNDKFADGRDVSWLWDVQFKELIPETTELITSGIRGYDMALRLKHDGLASMTIPSVAEAIEQLVSSNYQKIVVIPTYTALFEVRLVLSKHTKVSRIW